MKRLALIALLTLLAGTVGARAQTIQIPQPNAGIYGAYNTSLPTCVTGSGCWLQTDANGRLIVTGTFTSTGSLDPCQLNAKNYSVVNIATATSTVISTGVAAKKKYICSVMLYPGGADNVAIIQATTGTACATAPAGVIGGATAATGIVMTAQAGFVLGDGNAAVAATTTNQTDLCIITSAAVQLSGVISTVDQ